ncbi:MAG: type II toxin-antitoxin system RelE/ParE family toxin [Acidobacteriaceae bacterium]
MRIWWTNRASAQLEAAFDFIADDNVPAAEKQLDIIKRAVEQLANFPEMGRPGRVDGTRELVIQSTPYIVAYRVKAQLVRVVALLHGARRWPTHF